MKVLVIGANGQIGKQVMNKLSKSTGDTPVAMVRKAEQLNDFKNSGLEAVHASLTGTVDELATAMQGCDAVVFTAGSGGHTGYDQTLLIDLDGAGKAIEAAEQAGVSRFVMVSAIHANDREKWTAIEPYMAAKHYADKMLMNSSLDYTIVRPGGLLNEPGIGKVQASASLERNTIPREDVAATIVEVLHNDRTIHQSFDLVTGEETIDEALKGI
ncbi:SDR family oxidoreductase [Cytobacillus sp. Sa5YUA1]|uniref:SDR family oxidoreductase n=1 Tax=Cytobacillus stercorigallinarum TaxID=2762240 RepID=A0ABR8QU94_9BACI|nr:SDR family oxidoreductase [Cytobacillus stercorigallinarum]MBD7939110.1 SDR family oxidoreductase [Cytobacillus stercorigallinarum]